MDGWGEPALPSYISQEGRDTSSEGYRPAPPTCPPLLTAADPGAGAKADAAKAEKSENTAGN